MNNQELIDQARKLCKEANPRPYELEIHTDDEGTYAAFKSDDDAHLANRGPYYLLQLADALEAITAKPRIWMGDGTSCPVVWVLLSGEQMDKKWMQVKAVCFRDIFLPGDDKPTIDPAGMTDIRTCVKVDWT